MIWFEHTEVMGWEAAIRGMRNPYNSWDKSDSKYLRQEDGHIIANRYEIGPNDHDLMMRLVKAGTDHRKFMRMIMVYVDVTAPLYWWKEFETYKVGTVSNSCSTMHNITRDEFDTGMFSIEHLIHHKVDSSTEFMISAMTPPMQKGEVVWYPINAFFAVVGMCEKWRQKYIEASKKNDQDAMKEAWWQIIQLLPTSYNQKRTVMMNYEVLANIYHARKHHKLDEWQKFCHWIESLPYSELITGGENSND